MGCQKMERHHQRYFQGQDDDDGKDRKLKTESEQVEREIDVNKRTELCDEHKHGVPLSHKMNRRKPTMDGADFDYGSANLTEKCPGILEQAHHSKSTLRSTSTQLARHQRPDPHRFNHPYILES